MRIGTRDTAKIHERHLTFSVRVLDDLDHRPVGRLMRVDVRAISEEGRRAGSRRVHDDRRVRGNPGACREVASR